MFVSRTQKVLNFSKQCDRKQYSSTSIPLVKKKNQEVQRAEFLLSDSIKSFRFRTKEIKNRNETKRNGTKQYSMTKFFREVMAKTKGEQSKRRGRRRAEFFLVSFE